MVIPENLKQLYEKLYTNMRPHMNKASHMYGKLHLITKEPYVTKLKYKFNQRCIPFLFWNLVTINIVCFYPLIKHGKMREDVFRKRGSYNTAIDTLPLATGLTLGSWQVSKRLWNIQDKPWYQKLIKPENIGVRTMTVRNINFAAFALMAGSMSYLYSNYSMLDKQDNNMRKFINNSPNLSPDSLDEYTEST